MKCHPVCELMPAMSEADYEALKADIAKHGQRVPILVYKGQIVDGRHRFRACKDLNKRPVTEEAKLRNGESLVELAFSLNFPRRHLTQSQKAAIAVGMLPMLEAEAKERQRGGDVTDESKGKAAAHASKIAGVSTRYIEKAKQVKESDPHEFEKVRSGEKALTATQEAKPPARDPVQVKDGLGRVVPDKKLAVPFSTGVDQFDQLMKDVTRLKSTIKELSETPLGVHLTFTQIEADLTCVRSALKFAKPYAPCPYCEARGCRACRSQGWVGQDVYEQAPKELKK